MTNLSASLVFSSWSSCIELLTFLSSLSLLASCSFTAANSVLKADLSDLRLLVVRSRVRTLVASPVYVCVCVCVRAWCALVCVSVCRKLKFSEINIMLYNN